MVDTITAYLTQVITLVTEEEVVDNLTCTGIIGRISVTQLAVDIQHSLLFTVGDILLQSIEDGRIIRRTSFLL